MMIKLRSASIAPVAVLGSFGHAGLALLAVKLIRRIVECLATLCYHPSLLGHSVVPLFLHQRVGWILVGAYHSQRQDYDLKAQQHNKAQSSAGITRLANEAWQQEGDKQDFVDEQQRQSEHLRQGPWALSPSLSHGSLGLLMHEVS